jgi:shikimate kinase
MVGLPGSGKSTIGKALGEVTGRGFLDFDSEIERRVGTSIADIFAMRGEPHFRNLEQQLTTEVATWRGGLILCPGGGWIGNPGALSSLRPPARVVWLKVRPVEAMRRMGEQAQRRPLLNRMSPGAELEQLLKEREPLYAKADVSINTEMFPLARIVERIQQESAAWPLVP